MSGKIGPLCRDIACCGMRRVPKPEQRAAVARRAPLLTLSLRRTPPSARSPSWPLDGQRHNSLVRRVFINSVKK